MDPFLSIPFNNRYVVRFLRTADNGLQRSLVKVEACGRSVNSYKFVLVHGFLPGLPAQRGV